MSNAFNQEALPHLRRLQWDWTCDRRSPACKRCESLWDHPKPTKSTFGDRSCRSGPPRCERYYSDLQKASANPRSDQFCRDCLFLQNHGWKPCRMERNVAGQCSRFSNSYSARDPTSQRRIATDRQYLIDVRPSRPALRGLLRTY